MENISFDIDRSEDDIVPLEFIQSLGEGANGEAVFEVVDPDKQSPDQSKKESDDFYKNLAEDLGDEILGVLASKLLDGIKDDKDSRQDWENSVTLSMKYLGFKVEESRKTPYASACACFDTTMSIALIRGYATARAELFPASGPCKSQVIGISTPETDDEAERVKIFLNHYLTQIDKEYYPDSELLLFYVYFFGCAFRKIYQDPILDRPTPRTIKPQDFIVNNHTTSLMNSDRMTHQYELSKKHILMNQKSGEFIEFKIPSTSENEDESIVNKTIKNIEGINSDSSENNNLFKFYECHTNLDFNEIKDSLGLNDDNRKIPRPYVVTICEQNRKIVSIKRNWKEGDEKFERLTFFVKYSYIRGFGMYSLGLAQLLGSNAIAQTSILRKTIDAGDFQNFPGGLKTKTLRLEENDKAIGPGEFHEVETNGMPIGDCIMALPYHGPSEALIGLMKDLVQQTSALGSTADTQIPENNPNAPVGTTLSLLEVQNRVQSTVLRSLHVSLCEELKLIFNLFGEYLPDEPYPFKVPGSEHAIMKKDFSDRINIVPVSDPSMLTSAHRLLRSEAILKLANAAPDIHDMREAYYRMYSSMNVDNIDKLIPEPKKPIPLDALTENMIMLSGKEAMVSFEQDDDTHLVCHIPFSLEQKASNNIQVYIISVIHIQHHKAFRALKMILKMSEGDPQFNNLTQLSADKLLEIPEIQNLISSQDSKEIMEQQKQAQEAAQNQPKPIDPNMVMLQDIEQRREAAHLKNEEVKLKVEEAAYEAQLKFEGEKAKMEAQRDIADDKNEVTLTVAQSKV